MANIPALVRLPVFAFVLLCAIIDLGLYANIVKIYNDLAQDYYFTKPSFPGLGVATAVLAIVFLAPMLIIDFLRTGAPTSWIVVELAVTGLLWILFLATGAATADRTSGCSGVSGSSFCSQVQAAEAFAFLAWIALMAYFILLLVFAIIAFSRGNKGIWTSSTRDTDFNSASATTTTHHPTTTAGGPATTQPAMGTV